jgi:hypothetical protein
MSAPFIVPFNFQPVSVSVKTASYTIPAGKYARVVVEVDSGGVFTIGGVSAVTSSAFVNIDTVAGFSGGTATYTVPTGFRAEACFAPASGGAGTTAQINGNVVEALGLVQYYDDHSIGPGGVMSVVSPGGGVSSVQGVAIPSNATHRQADFWLPTGAVISGSGNWRAVVMEYNQIS